MMARAKEEVVRLRYAIAGCLAVIAVVVLIAVMTVGGSSEPAAAGPIAPEFKTPTPTRTPVRPRSTPTPTPPPVRIGPAEGPGVMVSQCRGTDRQAVETSLLWNPSRSGQQWLDLSIFNNGFQPGTYLSIGPLGKEAWGYVLPRMTHATTHYARVNTLTSQGWMPSQTLGFFTPICDLGNYYPMPAADMWALQGRLADAVRSYGVNAAVAVTDLQTGETVHVNGDQVRLPGCTLNLFNLMQVVADVQFGRYPEAAVGDLIYQTINRSDAVLSRNLAKTYVGGGNVLNGLKRVNMLMQSLGMTTTLYDHPPGYWNESLNGGIDNRTTAIETNRGLRGIWEGRALDPVWRDYLLRKMTLVKPGLNYLVSVGTGGSYVSHKNGFLWSEGWVDNDIGIVWFERGGQRYGYAISYFSGDLTNKYGGIPLGQQLSVLTYAWFDARYNAP